jgi:hypothetical protein
MSDRLRVASSRNRPPAAQGGLGAGRLAAGSRHSKPRQVCPDGQYRPEIEPVMRWIEDTHRRRSSRRPCRLKAQALPYRELLPGLFMGIRASHAAVRSSSTPVW